MGTVSALARPQAGARRLVSCRSALSPAESVHEGAQGEERVTRIGCSADRALNWLQF